MGQLKPIVATQGLKKKDGSNKTHTMRQPVQEIAEGHTKLATNSDAMRQMGWLKHDGTDGVSLELLSIRPKYCCQLSVTV